MQSNTKATVLHKEGLKCKADIVIAGGGLSGLSAALTAAENGIKVIVLEKMHFLGGAGLFPEGSLGIGTRYQKKNGIQTTTDKVFSKVMEAISCTFIFTP